MSDDSSIDPQDVICAVTPRTFQAAFQVRPIPKTNLL
jgi:hypothetical protein